MGIIGWAIAIFIGLWVLPFVAYLLIAVVVFAVSGIKWLFDQL